MMKLRGALLLSMPLNRYLLFYNFHFIQTDPFAIFCTSQVNKINFNFVPKIDLN